MRIRLVPDTAGELYLCPAATARRRRVRSIRTVRKFQCIKASSLILLKGTGPAMAPKVDRRTVDLSGHPNLVVVYLGMRVNRLTGLKTLLGFGPRISASVAAQPQGLLLHENFVFSLFPMHVGMRQYWSDLDALLAWTRSDPHREWWKKFLADSGGTGFWHETYLMRGGMEAIYDDVRKPIGFMRFAPVVPARGAMFGASHRAAAQVRAADPVVSETELYGPEP